jgi:hypothetical protein
VTGGGALSTPAGDDRAILPPNSDGPLDVRTSYERVHAPAADGEAEKLAEIVRWASKEALFNGAGNVINPEIFDEAAQKIIARRASFEEKRKALARPTGEGLEPWLQLGRPEQGSLAAFHDLPGDTVIFSNSGVYITAGDVRTLQRWLRSADSTIAELREAAKGQLVVVNVANARVAELEKALADIVAAFVNPHDGGQYEVGEVPVLDRARAALSTGAGEEKR